MKAVRMYGVGDLRIEEVPIPKIEAGDILVKVRAASVCGTDIRMFQNGYPGIDEKHPRVLGHEIAGEIAAVGKEVSAYRVGQRVAVAPNMGCGVCRHCIAGNSHLCASYRALGIHLDGGFAEYCKVPEQAVRAGNVCVLDDSISYAEAAINEPLSCVYNGFERCEIGTGDDVLVIGAGPIGIMHAKLARFAGAGRVWIYDLNQARLDVACRLEKTLIPITGDLKKEIFQQTEQGVDVCIVACPAPVAQAQALELCAYNARILFFGGVPQTKQPVPLDTNLIHYRQLKISGTTRASLSQFKKTLTFLRDGKLELSPMITRRYKLEEIEAAFVATAQAEGLKNVIQFD